MNRSAPVAKFSLRRRPPFCSSVFVFLSVASLALQLQGSSALRHGPSREAETSRGVNGSGPQDSLASLSARLDDLSKELERITAREHRKSPAKLVPAAGKEALIATELRSDFAPRNVKPDGQASITDVQYAALGKSGMGALPVVPVSPIGDVEEIPNPNSKAGKYKRDLHRAVASQKTGIQEIILGIGGGTGATVGGTGDAEFDQDLLRRMRYQDKAVMLLLLLAYTGSLAFSASLAYRQASNDSPVTYYADPRYHNIAIDDQDVDSFLDAFNQPPKGVQLQVSGLMPLPPIPEYIREAAVEWLGSNYRVAFSFALDLSPWMVREGAVASSPAGIGDPYQVPEDAAGNEATVGVSAADVEVLRDFLQNNYNDLAAVDLCKEVSWPGWEELATNIKHQIRQSGFGGIISVRRSKEEHMLIYKNKPWANFMHSRTTKVLCALSVLGWLIYQPYMLIRHRSVEVQARFKVDCSIDTFWELIATKIGPDGFDHRQQQ